MNLCVSVRYLAFPGTSLLTFRGVPSECFRAKRSLGEWRPRRTWRIRPRLWWVSRVIHLSLFPLAMYVRISLLCRIMLMGIAGFIVSQQWTAPTIQVDLTFLERLYESISSNMKGNADIMRLRRSLFDGEIGTLLRLKS
jgi:hypothetical protein